MNIAIMTARSGSKSVPQKNIRMLGPLPLLGWGISALSKSTKIDKIILSTDSEKYFEIGKSIPIDTLESLSSKGINFLFFLFLYAK